MCAYMKQGSGAWLDFEQPAFFLSGYSIVSFLLSYFCLDICNKPCGQPVGNEYMKC